MTVMHIETGTNIVTGNGAGVTFGSWVTDSWSRNIVFEGFNGPTSVGRYSMRITIANNEFRRSLTTDTSAGQAADVLVNGQQVLVTGALTRNNPGSYTFGITTGSAVGGPNVAFNCFAIGYDVTAPHQRWATGFLIDASVTAQSIFGNRGILGSGQGWVVRILFPCFLVEVLVRYFTDDCDLNIDGSWRKVRARCL